MDSSLNTINFSALTQDEKNTQILNAARNGSTAVVAQLIAAKANVEATNQLGRTAKAPVPVTFRYSASTEQRKEEELSTKQHNPNGNR